VRPACIICVSKHLAAAEICFLEYRRGYNENLLRTIGHLEHAWQEAEELWPALAAEIYAEKKNLENDPDNYVLKLQDLLVRAADTWEQFRRERDADLEGRRKTVHPEGGEGEA